MRPALFAIPFALLVACTRGGPDAGGYVDANGVHTWYERRGSGPPVVLLHGAAMVAEGWRPQVDALAPHYTVYVPERRGVGRTADVPGDWSYELMAADTAAFMEALGLREARIVGLSDGAIVGLILAYTRPDLVGRLALSGANLDVASLGEFGAELQRMSAADLIEAAPPQVVRWLEIQRRVSPDRGANLAETFEKMRRMWLAVDIPVESLGRIRAPALIMAGDRDMFSVEHTAKIRAAIPDAQLLIVPDATHFWLEEKPELANRFLLEFLAASEPES